MGAFGARTAAKAVLAFGAASVIWVGVACIAYAISVALAPWLGVAGGAAVAGVLLLIGPLLWIFTTLLRTAPTEQPARTEGKEHNAIMNVLSVLAKDRPLLAVAGAALVGAAEMLLKRRSKP